MIRGRVELSNFQKVANGVRHQFEDHEVDASLLQTLYALYNPAVGDVVRFVEQANEFFPHLNCGLATVYLKYVLGIGREEQGKFGEEEHIFLFIEEDGPEQKTVVDNYV